MSLAGEIVQTLLLGDPVPVASLRRGRGYESPCDKCPFKLAGKVKVAGVRLKQTKLIAIGLGPGEVEEAQNKPFVGPSGQLLRSALSAGGLDPETEVAYANLLRCRLPGDDFDGPDAAAAIRRCRRYLDQEINGALPLLVLGQHAAEQFLSGSGRNKPRIVKERGLWHFGRDGKRMVFAARHPASILRAAPGERKGYHAQFMNDIKRCAQFVQEGPAPSDVEVTIYRSLDDAGEALGNLVASGKPFAFDLETYDAKESPSRRGVATDPCNPDFRVRGCAFAASETAGFWIEFRSWEDRKNEARKLLDPVFVSTALKLCQNGSFDHEGLVYNGWVTDIVNRGGDSMLAMIALGDTIRPPSYKLEYGVVTILGEDQYWVGTRKEYMRDLPIEQVANGAVNDAAKTLRLCRVLHTRMLKGEYL